MAIKRFHTHGFISVITGLPSPSTRSPASPSTTCRSAPRPVQSPSAACPSAGVLRFLIVTSTSRTAASLSERGRSPPIHSRTPSGHSTGQFSNCKGPFFFLVHGARHGCVRNMCATRDWSVSNAPNRKERPLHFPLVVLAFLSRVVQYYTCFLCLRIFGATGPLGVLPGAMVAARDRPGPPERPWPVMSIAAASRSPMHAWHRAYPARSCACDRRHTAARLAINEQQQAAIRWRTPCPRLSINRTARSKYRSPVRHPPVHALDSIIPQAQVPTPSGG